MQDVAYSRGKSLPTTMSDEAFMILTNSKSSVYHEESGAGSEFFEIAYLEGEVLVDERRHCGQGASLHS